jgi:hypothetical protein
LAGHDNGVPPQASGASAATRVAAAAVAGVCAGVLTAVSSSWQIGTLVGWDLAAGVYVAWTWKSIWPGAAMGGRGGRAGLVLLGAIVVGAAAAVLLHRRCPGHRDRPAPERPGDR